MEYKTAQELDLPAPTGSCWTCGFSCMPYSAKCYGVMELAKPIKIGLRQEKLIQICSTCLSVLLIANKEYLYKGSSLGEKPMGGPYRKAYLVSRDGKRVAIWKVLPKEPWLESIQELPPRNLQKR